MDIANHNRMAVFGDRLNTDSLYFEVDLVFNSNSVARFYGENFQF